MLLFNSMQIALQLIDEELSEYQSECDQSSLGLSSESEGIFTNEDTFDDLLDDKKYPYFFRNPVIMNFCLQTL